MARFTAPLKDEPGIVTNPSSPPSWFRHASEFSPQRPRKLHGLLPPLSTFPVTRFIGSIGLWGVRLQSSKRIILSCAFAPPRRLDLQDPLPLYSRPTFHRNPVSLSSLLSLLSGHSAFPDPKALLFTPLLRKRPRTVTLIPGSHTLGFGYPLDVVT